MNPDPPKEINKSSKQNQQDNFRINQTIRTYHWGVSVVQKEPKWKQSQIRKGNIQLL